MAIQFPDPNVTATSNDKSVHTKTVRLLFSDFTTGGTVSVKAILPADSSILSFRLWNKTVLSGGGITAATLSIGTNGTPTNFVNAVNALGASGTFAVVTPVTNIMQAYGLPLGTDISLTFTGTATTGNPTAGEMYVTIEYVR